MVFEKGPASWGARVPGLPGVISVGGTREEVDQFIREAIALHLDGMREEGIPIPALARLWFSGRCPSSERK